MKTTPGPKVAHTLPLAWMSAQLNTRLCKHVDTQKDSTNKHLQMTHLQMNSCTLNSSNE